MQVNQWTLWNKAFSNGMTYSDEIFDDYKQNGIHNIYNFVRTGPDGCHLQIQVIFDRILAYALYSQLSLQYTCMSYFSTSFENINTPLACVMNFITFNTTYSLYPCATFEKCLNLIFCNKSDANKCYIAKYALHGWSAIANVWPQTPGLKDLFLLHENCSVTDKHSWVVPLNPTGVGRHPHLTISSEWFPGLCVQICTHGKSYWFSHSPKQLSTDSVTCAAPMNYTAL
jgi:hypothetical protein